jgi:hypothetical protein
MLKRMMVGLGLAVSLLFGTITMGALPAQAATTYWYAGGQQAFAGTLPTGIIANVGVYKPTLDQTAPGVEAHTLEELEVEKTIGGVRQIVEVGWSVEPAVFGDTNSHLWTGVWAGGTFCGYNTTVNCTASNQFVQCNTTSCGAGNPDVWDAADTLTVGTAMRLGIQYQATGTTGWWIIAYLTTGASEWLGYFPDSVWTGAGINGFTAADHIQAFAEVANTSLPLGCTDDGDGTLPTTTTGAVIGSVTAVGLASSLVDIDSGVTVTDATKYNLVAPAPGANVRTIRVGGPGAC